MASISSTETRTTESGLAAGLAAYLLWGFLPLLFDLLRHVGAMTLVADRTLWSLLLVGTIMIVGGRTAEVRSILRDRAAVRSMALAAFVLAANWLIYVYAVETNQVLEASFGYFINPMVNVAIGMLVLGERLNRWQGVSVAIAVVAIGIQAVGLGGVPYIALGLALTFALYGYLRKTAKASSATGLFVETLILSPAALAYLLFSFVIDGGVGVHADPYTLFLLVMTGPATAVPLLLFAYAVQRLRLTTIGMLQYLAPSIAFILAIVVFGEHLNWVRLLSFGMIWLSLIVYTADSVVRRRRGAA
ncbi:EamA family transporter RarD [Devosia sp. ZB163]|uniref:EamA family transporter RarD n=1 Tax=Devosia sp. ZB163 TaxID=3025938 RepID=UPI002362124D|nr:EamA family transporter RarD [Devosia sp. ZB163]MDC9825910.1 EamA family transporter RarD [Devosia sp. ZB163]